MKRMACVLALTAGAGFGAAATATPALAEKAVNPATSGLQLTLNAAGTVPNDAALALDVRFEGGSLRLVELVVDGTTVKKKNIATRNSHGHIEFQIEAGLLAEGTHDIVVKAMDADGNTATTTTQIKVTGGASGLVRFQFPKSKAMVQGVVPIEIKLDPSIRNPYVSFFIDDTFLSLTNYAPFTVNWDSTRVTNGLHTVSVEVYDGETLARVKSTSIQLNINNPGGLTNRQKETNDLNRNQAVSPKPTDRLTADPKNGFAFQTPSEMVSRLLDARPSERALRTGEPRFGNSQQNTKSDLRPVVPASDRTVSLIAPAVKIDPIQPVKGSLPNRLANHDRLNGAAANREMRIVKPGLMGLVSSPREFAALQSVAPSDARLAHTVRPRRAGNMAARPALTMDTNLTNPGSTNPGLTGTGSTRAVEAIKVTPAVKPTPMQIARSPRPLVGPGALSGNAHSMQIAFDNTRIAFDVQPRVEHGLPLAPFRQIFEHTGGTIQWYNQSKTLRAFNSAREIEFKVGEDEAKVNNQTVKMEAKTFIEKGRTIVPLSFVRDALDVNVSYDATTGHLRIESKK